MKVIEPYLPFISIWGNKIEYGTKELADFAAQLRDKMLDEALQNTNTQSDELKNDLRTYFHAASLISGSEIVLRFKTNASFENDWGIDDPQIKKFGPVRSVFKDPIYLADSCLLPIHNK